MNRILAATYPDAHIELNFSNPLELLVATILSARNRQAGQLDHALGLRALSRRRRVRRSRSGGIGGADQTPGFFRAKTDTLIKLGAA